MMEMLLAVCVVSFCEYIAPPVTYVDEDSCWVQAAMLAGMVSQRYRRGAAVTYRFRCQPADTTGADAQWVEITLRAEL